MAQPNMESDKCQLSYLGGANIAKGQEWLVTRTRPRRASMSGPRRGMTPDHPHARGATAALAKDGLIINGFNPRPGAGGDCVMVRAQSQGPVSIHAPARGATNRFKHVRRDDVVSIHAPARGATERWRAGIWRGQVSIHAPARGATKRASSVSLFLVFQSTPPRGGRRGLLAHFYAWYVFQSTPRRGARREAAHGRKVWVGETLYNKASEAVGFLMWSQEAHSIGRRSAPDARTLSYRVARDSNVSF